MKAPLLLLCLFIPMYTVAAVPEGYQRIGEAYSIPPELLYAVALTESEAPGIGKPWPWTANVAGEGLYFASRQALFDALNELQKRGVTHFDVGPAQINWYWNGGLFDSLWEATDPYVNLQIAASLLRDYYQETGSFEVAVGRYHAPSDPQRAERYRNRVWQRLARVKRGRQ